MKKIIILLGAITLLTGCGEDFPTIDQTTAENNAEDSGSNYATYTHTGSGAYQSPWDLYNKKPVGYFFQSSAASNTVFIRITPYIGLAYFDDNISNGVYLNHNLASGVYPNLFANGSEIGNYIEANPIILGSDPNYQTQELKVFSTIDHCPLINVNIGINYNLAAIKFDVINNDMVQPAQVYGYTIAPAPAAATPQEEALLAEYGKVFYYKVEFGLTPHNFTDTHYVLALEADVTADAEWVDLNFTDGLGGSLYAHNGGGVALGTREIVVAGRDLPDEIKPSGVSFLTNNNGERKITTSAFHIWGNSPITPSDNVHILIE